MKLAWWLAGLLAVAQPALAQYVPLVSGGIGILPSRDNGITSFQPVVSPLVAAPIGQHLLAEGRFYFEEFYVQNNNTGPYVGSFIKDTDYLQLDAMVAPKLTFVVGRFLTPFGIYNERVTALWLLNFQDAPLIFGLGTRTTGSGDGAMVRGVLLSNAAVQVNYLGYFSVRSNVGQFQAARVAGDRIDFFFPGKRLELGTSYARFLQDTRYNSVGAHLSWLPWRSPFQVRSEYAHGPHAQGYWIESSYRLSQWRGPDSLAGRVEPLFRMQQTFRESPGAGDGLPSAATKQADFGLDYHLPHEVRFNTSYSRKFSTTGNANLWDVSLTYRFLFPVWREKK
jgi:hypothetical protein